jgi:hypothetical protein
MRCGTAALLLSIAACIAPAQAQITSTTQLVLPIVPPTEPPWSAFRVFDPLLYPQIWDREVRQALPPEDRPVRTRLHPGYEPVGVRAGSWMFHPSVTAGGLYNSNVFASNTRREGDVVGVVSPAVRGYALWERHALEFDASVRSTHYRNHPGLDQTDASFRGRARIDLTHDSMLLARVQAARLHEGVGSLSSPASAVEPTPYSLLSGDVSYRKEFNRLIVSFGGLVNSYNYGSTRAQNGTPISLDARDGQIYAGHTRVDYAVSPKFGLFGAFEGNRREVRGTPIQSASSSGYRTLGGVTLELSHLVTAEFAGGYASQQFDASTIGTVEGASYRAMLVWSPTRSVDVWFKAEQAVTQVTETNIFGVRANALQLGVDYEIRRNVVLSVAGAYENDKFFGQLRDDDVFTSLSELKYLLNRHLSIGVIHRYFDRNSSVPSSSYNKHEVGLNVTATF